MTLCCSACASAIVQPYPEENPDDEEDSDSFVCSDDEWSYDSKDPIAQVTCVSQQSDMRYTTE